MKIVHGVLILGLMLLSGACSSSAPIAAPIGAPAGAPTPTRSVPPTTVPATATTSAPSPVAPTAAPLPTRPARSLDLGNGRWLVTHSLERQDAARNYTIKAQWPTVEGVSTPQTEQFNLTVQQLVTTTLNDFQQMITEPLPGANNFIYMNYQVLSAGNGLVSLLFDISTYTGGAHPNTVHHALNYDLDTGQALTWADVFKPSVDVVNTLAVIATDDLTRTNRLMFPEGAEPRPENYQVWNFDFNGLLLTFDQYQVMPYAYGPQTVAIPYYVLQDKLKPDSPLADFWQLTKR